MAIKWRKARRRISLFNEIQDESDTGDNMDLDQADDKYLLQLQKGIS